MLKTCNNCQFLKRKPISGSNETHAYCSRTSWDNGMPKYIKCNLPSDFFPISVPYWCPDGKYEEDGFLSEYMKETQKWENVPRHVSWESIKLGDIIHIPKINKTKARTMKVECITDYSISGHEVDVNGKSTSGYMSYVYPKDTAAKYMVKLRNF